MHVFFTFKMSYKERTEGGADSKNEVSSEFPGSRGFVIRRQYVGIFYLW